jgi:hypothetical protein
MMLLINIKFWIYTKCLDHYLIKKDFDKVEIFLNLKKDLAKVLREIIKKKNSKQ